MTQLTAIQLEGNRLAAAKILAETRQAHDKSVADAQRGGVDPTRDVAVQALKRNLHTAAAQHEQAVRAHTQALKQFPTRRPQ